jgi:NAD(P)-dependent dehydrogenase (short-subunit alcohol dehydrogenase family)
MGRQSKGKIVVVTGASAGLGRAIARGFAARGARVGLLARGIEGLIGAKHDVEERGGTALMLPTDVADPVQVEEAAAAVEDRFGPIDVWVNNAMVTVLSPVKQMGANEYRRVTEVTYLGAVHGTLTALRRMLPRDRGTIVQVGSALAYRAIPLQSACCGAKHALRGFTDSLRSELIHDRSRIRLTMVHMPALNTPQFRWLKSRMPRKARPLPPVFQPEVGAEAVVYAADHYRREFYVGYPTVKAIVGNKFLPAYGDRVVARDCWEGQMGEAPEDPDRGDNLWGPRPGDHGAHGVFDDRARGRSLQLRASLTRGLLASLGAALGGLLLAGVLASRRPLVGRLRDRFGPRRFEGMDVDAASIRCDLSGCAPVEELEAQ